MDDNSAKKRSREEDSEEMRFLKERIDRLEKERDERIGRLEKERDDYKEKYEGEKERADMEKSEKEKYKEKCKEEQARANGFALYSLHNLISKEQTIPKIELLCNGSSASHTGTSRHNVASATISPIKLEKWDIEMFNKKTLNVSSLFLNPIQDGKLSYGTEADVSNYVGRALDDAIRLVKDATGQSLVLRHEASLFSERPDHIVVYDSVMNVPVLVVEDKKPLPKSSTLTGGGEATTPIGQVFDYFMGMKSQGCSCPFAVLTTFKKSIILWEENNEKSKRIAKGSNRLNELLGKIKKKTDSEHPNESKQSIIPVGGPPATVQKAPRVREVSESPPKLIPEDNPYEKFDIDFKPMDAKDRKLLCSDEFEMEDIVRVFWTAIICGLIPREEKASDRTIFRPTVGTFDALRLMAGSKKGNYTWGTLRVRAVTKIDAVHKQPSRGKKNPKAYYATSIVGMGATSKAFITLDGNGFECVIKMYTKQVDDDGNFIPTPNFNRLAKETTTTEAKALISTYDFLKDKVSKRTINGLHSVVMPFFKPIAKKFRVDDEDIRKGIEDSIGLLYDKGMMYKRDDIAWRHVGMYEKNVVLFDLGTLDEVGDTSKEDIKKHHMDILEERAGTEPCVSRSGGVF